MLGVNSGINYNNLLLLHVPEQGLTRFMARSGQQEGFNV